MRRTSPVNFGLAGLAPAVIDKKQSNRRLSLPHSGRAVAHKKGLATANRHYQYQHQPARRPRPAANNDAFDDASVDEGSRVRALLQKATAERVAKKAAYLRRCVEDADRQPAPKAADLVKVQRGKITHDVRANIVTWLLRCNDMFQLLPETAETAVYLLDRLLSTAHIPTEKHVRIVAATSMLIAAKTCEQQGQGVTVADLVRACGAVFSANDVQRMERVILNKFGWACLGKVVTPYTVASALIDVAACVPSDEAAAAEVRRLVGILMGEALAMPWYLDFSVVETACGALKVVLERFHDDRASKQVNVELSTLAHVDPATVDECARKMRSAHVEDIPML